MFKLILSGTVRGARTTSVRGPFTDFWMEDGQLYVVSSSKGVQLFAVFNPDKKVWNCTGEFIATKIRYGIYPK